MSEDDLNPTDRMMVDSLYWWGVPTLFRCPHDPDPAACDIALVGVPHSTGNGTTEHDQHLGPRSVRDVSALARKVHMDFEIDPWAMARIHDLGDVPLPELNDNEASVQRMTDFYKRIDAAGCRPVSVGGDHAITGGILQALAGKDARLTNGEKVAIFHLDAHTDAYASIPHFFGAYKSAAHWAAYLVEDCHVDAHRSVQVGMRGNPRTLDWRQPSVELGYEMITIDRYREMGPDAVVETIRKRAGDGPVYITLDLDCFDTLVAPGVANLEVGVQGFQVDEVMQMLRGLRGLDIIGGDVVCLMPPKDSPNKQTSHLAAACMFEMISLIADRIGTD